MQARAFANTRTISRSAALAFALILFAACGGGSDPVAEEASATSPDDAAPESLGSVDATSAVLDTDGGPSATGPPSSGPSTPGPISIAQVITATSAQPSLSFESSFEPDKQAGFATRGWLDTQLTRGQSETFLTLYGEPQQALTRTFLANGQASVQSMVTPDSPRPVDGGMAEFVSTFVFGASGTSFAEALASVLPRTTFDAVPVQSEAPGGEDDTTHLRAENLPAGENFDIWVDDGSRMVAIEITSPSASPDDPEPALHTVTFTYDGSPFAPSSPAAGERTALSWASNIAATMERRLESGDSGPISFLGATCINMLAAGEPADVPIAEVVVELILLNCTPENVASDWADEIASASASAQGVDHEAATCLAQVIVDEAIASGPVESIWFMRDRWDPAAEVRPEIDRRLVVECGLNEAQWLGVGLVPAQVDIPAFCQRVRDRYEINPHDPDVPVNTALWFAWDLEYQRRYYPPTDLRPAHEVLVEAQERVVEFVATTGLTMMNHAESPTVQSIYAEPDVQEAWRDWSRYIDTECTNPLAEPAEATNSDIGSGEGAAEPAASGS